MIACRGLAAVSFQIELPLEGLVDRLDDLPERFEQVRSGPFGFSFAVRARQLQVTFGEVVMDEAGLSACVDAREFVSIG